MLPKEFKLDKDNIWYIDSKDIEIHSIIFPKVGSFYNENNGHFYTINGINDWIIKDTRDHPVFFNQLRIKEMLKKLYAKQGLFSDIDFPIGYYKEKDKLSGIIIPYYEKSLSIRKFIYSYPIDEIKKYYNHDDNDYSNILLMCLDVLNILQELYNNGISYLDVHAGNFLLYKNAVKVIDFEPGYVSFNSRDGNRKKIIEGYINLINKVFNKLNMKKDNDYYFGNDFDEINKNIKRLEKRMKR